jgi:hypothetical protein
MRNSNFSIDKNGEAGSDEAIISMPKFAKNWCFNLC